MKYLNGALLATLVIIWTPPSMAAESSAERTSTTGAPPEITRTVLRRTDVPGSNYEVVYVLVKIAADSVVAKHTHPGTVFGYLIGGNYTILIDGSPHLIQPGQSWEVPRGVAHEERTGIRGAEILAVFTVERGMPLTSAAD
jgi:quercetin dioxygenase-like cupin family protein